MLGEIVDINLNGARGEYKIPWGNVADAVEGR